MPTPTAVYPALARYRQELPVDAVVYEAGVVPSSFYMLLSGAVVLEAAADATGQRDAVSEVSPGGLFGVESAFTGRPTPARARATVQSTVLAIPFSMAASAFRVAPEFAVAVVRQLSGERLGMAPRPAPSETPTVARRTEPIRLATRLPYNEDWFFPVSIRCPGCDKDFSTLRVRSRAVRPAGRDSDFRITYETVDPSLYAVTVCPHCAYASYAEDFAELPEHELRAIHNTMPARVALLHKDLSRERDLADAMVSLVLARMCAEARGASQRRMAGLFHRAAWVERAHGHLDAELVLIRRTRDAYISVFEQDPEVQDAAAVRVAYLLGDLSLRLGEVATARRWLLECVRMPATGEQVGLIRMAQDRLADAPETPDSQRSA